MLTTEVYSLLREVGRWQACTDSFSLLIAEHSRHEPYTSSLNLIEVDGVCWCRAVHVAHKGFHACPPMLVIGPADRNLRRLLYLRNGSFAIPQKSPCACSLERWPPLTQLIELRLGLSQGSALQAETLTMRSKALPFLRQFLRWGLAHGIE